jgi:PAS domain S-box-containing protein
MILLDLIAFLTFVSALLFIGKAKQKNNLGYIAQAISRLYMTIIFVLEVHFEPFGFDMGDIGIAVSAVIIADIISAGIALAGRRYIKEIDYLKTVSSLRDLSGKFNVIVESAVTGFFTVDRKGNIEFVNQALLNLLEYSRDEIIGRNILDFVNLEHKDEILLSSKFNYKGIKITTKSGRIISTYFSGGYTRNGHDTITGSIIELN